MRARQTHDQYASLTWLLIGTAVGTVATVALALHYVESPLVAPIQSVLWRLAAAWILVWLPMFGFLLWSSTRLKKEWAHTQDEQAHAATAELKYRHLVDQARDIIYRTDDQGRFTFVNPIVTRIMGYSPQELLGRRFIELIRPDARAAAERFYGWQFVRKTPNTYYEFPALTKDGREIWIGQNVQVLLENGQVAGFHAMARDITERKRTEEALRESETFKNRILENSPDCIKVLDLEGRLLFMNKGGQELMEIRDIALRLNSQWFEFWKGKDKERARVAVEAARTGNADRFAGFCPTATGKPKWWDVLITPLLDANGAPDRLLAISRDITARKQMEEALRDSEKKYRRVVNTLQEGIWVIDQDAMTTFVNPHMAKMLGYDVDEMRGKHLFSFMDEQGVESCKRNLGRRQQGIKERHEFELVSKGGRRVQTMMETAPILDEDGNYAGAIAAVIDITEHKRTEEERHAALNRFIAVVDNSPIGILSLDVQGRVTSWSHAAEQMFGWTEEELLGRELPYLAPGQEQESETIWERVMQGERLGGLELRRLRKDGTPIDIAVWSARLCDRHGAVIGSMGLQVDITERKQAEAEIRRAQTFVTSIVENIPDMIFVKDAKDLRFVQFNKAGEELLGYNRHELIGKSAYDFFPKQEADFFTAKDRAVLDSKHLLDIPEEPIETKNLGTRILHTKKIPILDKEGNPQYLLGISEDITEHKRAEERLAKINACFLGFGVSPENNINRLTALCGELLGATCALYNYLDGQMLRTVGQWQAPPGFNPVDRAIGHICHDVIQQGGNQPMTVHRLQETPYAQTDPNVLPYKLQTYIGMPVKCQDTSVGSLCAVFQRDYVPCEADTKLLGIIAAAIGVEEERRLTEKDQKRMLAELAESRGRFEMFFRQTPSAISITTVKEGRFIDVNRQAEILTGYSRAELIGRTTLEMNLYVDPAERADIVQRINKTSLLTDLERQIRTKSGGIRTAVFSLVPIQMGSEPCLLSIAHDITERKRAESLLAGEKRVLEMISSDARLSTVLESIVRLVEEQQPGALGSILLLDKSGKTLHHGAAPSLPPSYTQAVDGLAIGPAAGSCGTAAFLEKTVIVSDISSDPLWATDRDLALPHGLRACWSIPIFSSDGLVLGTFAQYHRVPWSPTDDDLRLVERSCHLASIAIERARAEEVLRDANQALRTLSQRLLQVQEEDRRTIARDLHDEIGQSLTAIKLNVERARRTSDSAARDGIMKDCGQITDNVLEQVRDLSLNLHPSILDDLGLAYALKWYADRQAERAGLKIQVAADLSLPRLSLDIEITCFRIAQEALTNVVRHAQARHTGITLKQGAAAVELCIQDDGIGFVVDKAFSTANGRVSVGLTSMQERAKLLGGTVKITSALRCGTKVLATLPLLVVSPAGMPTEEVPRS